jgi:hypothetical protein
MICCNIAASLSNFHNPLLADGHDSHSLTSLHSRLLPTLFNREYGLTTFIREEKEIVYYPIW